MHLLNDENHMNAADTPAKKASPNQGGSKLPHSK
jgi:hypothetical protein